MKQINTQAISFPGPNRVSLLQSSLVAGIVWFFGAIGAITSSLFYGDIRSHYVYLPMMLTTIFISVFAREYRGLFRIIDVVFVGFLAIIATSLLLEEGFSPRLEGITSSCVLGVAPFLPYAFLFIWSACSIFISWRVLEDKEYDEWGKRTVKLFKGRKNTF